MYFIIVIGRLHVLVGPLGVKYKEQVWSDGSQLYLEKYLEKIKYICCICILYFNTFGKLYLQLYLNTFLYKYFVFVFRYIFASMLPISGYKLHICIVYISCLLYLPDKIYVDRNM